MTVKTTIKFLSDSGGAIDAGIEATQIAIMRARAENRGSMEPLLDDALVKLRAAKVLIKPNMQQQRT